MNTGTLILCLIGVLAMSIGAYLEDKQRKVDYIGWADILCVAGFVLILTGVGSI